jgi:hypothetical protein
MKQPRQRTTPQTTVTPTALSRRRLMGQAFLGGAAALVLTACGGGGGSDSSSNSRDLVAAFDRLKPGMTWDEAKSAVGWPPNSGIDNWSDSGYLLWCTTKYKVGDPVQYLDVASLSGNGLDITRYYFTN